MSATISLPADEVVCVDGFVSADVCQQMLRELRFTFWQPSGVMTRSNHPYRLSARRRSETSMQEWFSDELRGHLETLEKRIEETFGISPSRLESWQATRYQPTDEYEYHLDAGHHREEAAGDREYTLMLYLETPAAGGATSFRDLDLEFQAEAGRLLAWRNLLEDGANNLVMSHAALPVLDGQKTILVTWARERPLRFTTVEERIAHGHR